MSRDRKDDVMEVLKEYKDCQLIKRYGKPYLRFWGGREEDMICEETGPSSGHSERVLFLYYEQ